MAIIDARGNSGRDALLQTLLNKEKLAQEKERIGLQQKEFKLRQDAAAADEQRRRDMEQGFQTAAQLFALGGNLSQAAPSIDPRVLPFAIEGLQGFGQAQAAIQGQQTQNRIGASTANVAEATEGAQVATTTMNAERAAAEAERARAEAAISGANAEVARESARANLTNTQLRNQLQSQVLNGSDPTNGARAVETWIGASGQMTWAEAKEAVGYTGEDSIDPNLRFQAPVRASADAARAASFLPLMIQTNDTINALHDQGVRLEVASALQKGNRVPSIDILLNFVSDPEQQQLIQAQRSFADMYRFSLSGQQSSDAERLSMMLAITEQTGDSEAVLAQKRQLRQTMINSLEARSGGGLDPLQAARNSLELARRLGDEDITAAFEGLVEDVTEDMTSGVSISSIPGDNGFGDVESIIDAAGRR